MFAWFHLAGQVRVGKWGFTPAVPLRGGDGDGCGAARASIRVDRSPRTNGESRAKAVSIWPRPLTGWTATRGPLVASIPDPAFRTPAGGPGRSSGRLGCPNPTSGWP